MGKRTCTWILSDLGSPPCASICLPEWLKQVKFHSSGLGFALRVLVFSISGDERRALRDISA